MENREHSSNTSPSKEALDLARALDAFGVKGDVFKEFLEAQQIANKINAPAPEGEAKLHQEKKLIYDDENCFIYRRGNLKSAKKTWYIRFYDKKTKKRKVKSLETKDEVKAIAAARIFYQEWKGKLDKGQKLDFLTTRELVDNYLILEKDKITEIPRQGITPHRYRVKKQNLGYWVEFIEEELNHKKTPIHKIDPIETRSFGRWLMKKPKRYKDTSARSPEVINNSISEIKKCYKDVAINGRLLSIDQLPILDRLTNKVDGGEHKRHILELEEYKKLYTFLNQKYVFDKSVHSNERLKRVIFSNFIYLMANTGMRTKELFGLRVNEITNNPMIRDETTEQLLIRVRQTNSKTGKGRTIAADVRKKVNNIKKAYEKIGKPHRPQDYLFFNPEKEDRRFYTREQFSKRLRTVLVQSGLREDLDAIGKKINLYSFRHQYITYRLRYGNVPVALLAKAAGTSINMIDKTYAHIDVERQSLVLTRAQGQLKTVDLDLETQLVKTDEQ